MDVKDVSDVFNAPDLSMVDLKREIDIIGVRAILSILIADVVDFFNVGKTMNDKQIAITCDLIIDTYPYMKMEDLKLCFRNAMLLKYGKLYDRIDGAVIMGWLSEYSNQRALAATIVSDNAIKQLEANLNEGTFYQDYLVTLKERADNGDEEAKEHLDNHLKMQSFLKNCGYEKYTKEREKQKLYGRGMAYERQFNKHLK